MVIRAALMTIALTIAQNPVGYALNHDLRKDLFEALGPNAWGIYIILPIPFVVLGIIGYLLYRAWKAPSDTPPPSLN